MAVLLIRIKVVIEFWMQATSPKRRSPANHATNINVFYYIQDFVGVCPYLSIHTPSLGPPKVSLNVENERGA